MSSVGKPEQAPKAEKPFHASREPKGKVFNPTDKAAQKVLRQLNTGSFVLTQHTYSLGKPNSKSAPSA